MKTIIYATDYSENSISALKYAYAISSKLNARLWVIHVFNHVTLNFDLTEPYLPPYKENFEQNKNNLELFCEKHLGTNFNTKSIEIDAIENISIVNGIILKAKELQASLIVAGMTGLNVFNEFLLGSVSKELIKKSPYPVVVVPTEALLTEFKTIMYATDFEEEDIITISKLIEIVTPFEPTIHITHISTKKEHEGYQQMQWFKEMVFQKTDYKNLEFYIFFEEDIYNALCRYCDAIKADLVVMLERKKKDILKNIFHTDLVKKMKSHTAIPLMSFNEA